MPGATQLTRTPLPASSIANAFVKPKTAVLLKPYAGWGAPGRKPPTEETRVMLPPGFLARDGAASCANKRHDLTLISMTLSNKAPFVSRIGGCGGDTAALSTKMSSRPCVSIVCFTRAARSLSLPTWHAQPDTREAAPS